MFLLSRKPGEAIAVGGLSRAGVPPPPAPLPGPTGGGSAGGRRAAGGVRRGSTGTRSSAWRSATIAAGCPVRPGLAARHRRWSGPSPPWRLRIGSRCVLGGPRRRALSSAGGEVAAVSRFFGKKLPPHWVYVPSRRQVRELLRDLAADVRCVEFAGTGRGPTSIGLQLGYLERRVADDAWCCYLRLRGVPEAAVAGRRDELARAALRAIRQSVAECVATPAAAVVRPSRLHLLFEVGADGPISRCFVRSVDQNTFWAGCWWSSPGPV